MKPLILGVILAVCSLGDSQNVIGDIQLFPKVCYTQWFDRDNPSGFGDYEDLVNLRSEYPGKICSKPLAIEVQTLSGVPATSIGQVFQTYDTVQGFVCKNADQINGQCCLDYKVRFRCPCPWP